MNLCATFHGNPSDIFLDRSPSVTDKSLCPGAVKIVVTKVHEIKHSKRETRNPESVLSVEASGDTAAEHPSPSKSN